MTAAGAPPWTLLGNLQHSPDPLAGFKRAASQWGGRRNGIGKEADGKEGQGRKRRRGGGSWNKAG